MSKREQNWERLLNSLGQEFEDWLDSDNLFFQVRSEDFKKIKAKPVRLIPTYSALEIPLALLKRGLEHFRNLSGGCVLIQKEKFGLPTLFPHLPQNIERFEKTIAFPSALDVLKNLDLHNEETGIVLLKEFGLINKFLETEEEFKLGGRIKTKVSGEATIANKTFVVQDCQLEVDNFLESDNRIVIIEAKLMKESPRKSFSLHQFGLPTLLLSQKTSKPITSILLEYKPEGNSLRFRIYHYELDYIRGVVHLDQYRNLQNIEFILRTDGQTPENKVN